jgi:serine protease
MQSKRHQNGPAGFGTTTGRTLSGSACISLSLALAACGGDVDSGAAPASTPSAQSMTEVAAAASAASSSTVPLATALKMNTGGITPETSTDRFIVRYKTGTAERRSGSATQSKLDRLSSALPARARHFRRMGIGADVVTTERKLNGRETRAFMRAVASDPNVEYVEPDTPMSIASAANDPLYSSQWYLSSNLTPGTRTAGIRAEDASNMADGAGVVIGMVDNGITSHSDLNASVLPGYDFIPGNRGGDGSNPGITAAQSCPVVWHGTHVAGIMTAAANNSVGIAGVAPAAKLVSVRTVNACSIGYLSDVADGITWAAGGSIAGAPVNPNPAKVINVSLLGSGSCQATLQSAIDYATSQGAVLVAAAGNSGKSASSTQPANCRNVITVGGINSDGSIFSNSNFGPTVDVAAPGAGIWSTYNNGISSPGTEGYTQMDGTSMAAPMVSGVVALAKSVAPTPLTAAEMRTLIQQNVQPFSPRKPTEPLGPGILDASATVSAAKSGKIPVAADFTCSEAPNLMQVTCTDLSTARGGVPIKSWAWNFGIGGLDVVRTQSVNPYVNYDYAGSYEIRLTVTDTNGATSTLSRPFSVLPPVINDFSVDAPQTVVAKNGDMQYYELDIPSGVKGVTVTMTPSSARETAWLYLRAGTPSVLHPQCQSGMGNGNTATCKIANPAAGLYYVIFSAQSKLTGSTLTATYTQ